MFKTEDRDDGFIVVHSGSGRVIAHVQKYNLSETADPNLRVQKKIVTPVPYGNWIIHFTGTKLTLNELEAFMDKLEDKKE